MVRARRNVGGVKYPTFLKRSKLVTKSNHHYILKGNRALWLLFSIQYSDYGAATAVAKVSLYSTCCKPL